MKYEKTLLLFKPGVLERGLIGKILQRFEDKGLDILALKVAKPAETRFMKFYAEHKNAPFFTRLMKYMTSSYVVIAIMGGEGSIHACRSLVGSTDPADALPGSVRGDFGISVPDNVIHSSDSPKSAAREIPLFFTSSEIRNSVSKK